MDRERINFHERIDAYEIIIKKQASRLVLLSWIRLGLFVLLIVATVVFTQQLNCWSSVLAFVLLTSFIISVQRYNFFVFKQRQSKFLKKINHQNLLRKSLSLNTFDTGSEFIDEKHPFSSDLDVFGKHSLWQLVWRGSTDRGRNILSRWLTFFDNKEVISSRQVAVKEISSLIDWSQSFEAYGQHRKISSRKQHLFLQWVAHYSVPNSNASVFPTILSVVFIIANITLLISAISGITSFLFFGISILFSFIFLGQNIKMIAQVSGKIDSGGKILNIYLLLLKSILHQHQQRPFQSPYLLELIDQIAICSGKKDAIFAINQLKKIIAKIDQRSNIIYWIINPIFCLDFWLSKNLNAWIGRYQSQVEGWVNTVGTFEALNSMGGYTYTFEKTIFPIVKNNNSNATDEHNYEFYLESKALGHCLIPEERRVNNDFIIKDQGKIYLITGSNMSGKSTFLRTVGLNLVLAQCGMPVNATYFSFCPIKIFTSMRTTDNLADATSSFYAELKRIRQLIQQVELGEPVLFLLDELLKGTNSNDRHQGAKHLILQLTNKKVMGLISTHDLALSTERDLKKIIGNYSFNSTLEGEKINFDYQLVKGPCNSFNASVLMKNMGIDIP